MDTLIGLDFGKFTDFCALSVISRELAIDPVTGLPERDHNGSATYFYQCRGLRRWPLRTQFTEVIRRLVVITKRPDISRPIHICCDMTGIGSPILEQVRTALERYSGITIWGISITAGEVGSWSPNRKAGRGCFNVSKIELVSNLAEILGYERLILCPGEDGSPMENSDVLARELRAFKVKVTKTGYTGFEAMGSDHDDCVTALAVPLWVAGSRFCQMSTHNTSAPTRRVSDDDDDDDDDDTLRPGERSALAAEVKARQKAEAAALAEKQELEEEQIRLARFSRDPWSDEWGWT